MKLSRAMLTLTIALVGFLTNGCAPVNPKMPEELKYIRDNDCSTALVQALMIANQNIPGGQYSMGFLWTKGCGVPRNYRNAYDWYMLSAYNGDTRAMIALGEMHETGMAVDLDKNKAAEWYSLAARKGDQKAASKLVSMGRPVPKPDLVYLQPKPSQKPATQHSQPRQPSSGSSWFKDFAMALIVGAAAYYGARSASLPPTYVHYYKPAPSSTRSFKTFQTHCYVGAIGSSANINCSGSSW